jgi:hypothetical protein
MKKRYGKSPIHKDGGAWLSNKSNRFSKKSYAARLVTKPQMNMRIMAPITAKRILGILKTPAVAPALVPKN